MHLQPREAAAIVWYRTKTTYSINQIALVLHRSTRTVWKVIQLNKWTHKLFDNRRRLNPYMRRIRDFFFRRRLNRLRLCLEAFLCGYVSDIAILFGDKPP